MSSTNPNLEDEKFGKILNQAYIRKGVFIFISISIITMIVINFYNSDNDPLKLFAAFKSIKIDYIVLALIMILFDWWVGGIRNHIFINHTNPGISQRVCFDANLANIFLGAVTPSQTGGGPAHLYMLWRGGVKLTDGVAVSVMNYISTILFFVVSTGIAIFYVEQLIPDNNFSLDSLIKSGFIIFMTGFFVVLISLFAPERMGKLVIWLGSKLKHKFPKKFKNLDSQSKNLAAELKNYHKTIKHFLISKPFLLPLSFVITCIMYFNKYALAYVLLLGFGVDADFWIMIGKQAILFFVLYHAPSPGGSGIAEVGINGLMASILAGPTLTMFTILHRLFLQWLGAFVGSIIFFRELKKHNAEQAATSSYQDT